VRTAQNRQPRRIVDTSPNNIIMNGGSGSYYSLQQRKAAVQPMQLFDYVHYYEVL
jgi:hypothetical protein